MNKDEHLSLGKVAKRCNVSRTTVYRWIVHGHLKAYALPSGHFRVRPEDLETFCQSFGIPDVGKKPFGAIVPDDADAAARRRSDRDQRARNLSHLLAILIPARRLPGAVASYPQRRLRPIGTNRSLEHVHYAELGRIGLRHHGAPGEK